MLKNLANLKIILLNHENYVDRLNVDDNAAKSINILATNLSILIILTVQQNYFQICLWLNF